ncbi:bifunctional DNA primase/polymerase [Anaerobium acetethylicum]|uniref:bifunctional DNA primase/polymerase n=1 Tax=Anaerobium acetethylicum TaxID=1619234 RepID=UPI001A9A2F80|nr:bifunctional DNA primase/polymerase [Anaerobium acetethylicum]
MTYARNGFAIVPLKFGTKNRFLSKNGFNDATTDIEQIERWWTRYPDANIAVATGQKSGGLLVLDFDIKEDLGIYGYDYLRKFERQNGELPDTWMAISGTGGLHFWYRCNYKIDSATDLFERQSGVDIRADGGCIIAPPSRHPNGRLYTWDVASYDCNIANTDERVLKFVVDGMQYKKVHFENAESKRFYLPEIIYDGERDGTMFRFACSLLGRGVNEHEALLIMLQADKENCQPPLGERIVRNKLKSAIKTRTRKTRKGL